MANLSQEKRKRMLEFLQQIRAEHTDDTSIIAINEIESELTSKKYGLVWEEHTEEVDEQIKHNVPVFTEVSDKIITTDENLPYNFLLEGDNLHSLKLLEKTHKGKIDVIYIDPPYNTGNRDFVYDDDIIENDDGFRHSKWLSFMEKRLILAKSLLKDSGVILISIDDNEQANLKMLCDEIFGEINNLGAFIVKSTPNARDYGFVGKMHEYMLFYAKKANMVKTNLMPVLDKKFKYKDNNGGFNIHPLYNSNEAFTNLNRPNLFYPFYLNPSSKKGDFFDISLTKDGEDWIEIYPPKSVKNNVQFVWRWGKEKSQENINKEIVGYCVSGTEYRIVQKMRHDEKLIRSILDSSEYTSRKGTAEIEELLGAKSFSFPKPITLIRDVLFMATTKNAVILDFFAGSGTTGQAVMELNKQDGGNRRFILCTNNENGICENITYQRIKTVITGKRADGSEYSEGIPTNLKYFKTDYIAKTNEDEEYSVGDKLLEHIAEMVELQHGTKIDNEKHILVLTDEMADGLTEEKLANCEQLYVSVSVLLTTEQERMFKKMGIEVLTIPDYYFESELLEVGER